MTPQKVISAHKVLLDEVRNLKPVNYIENTNKNATIAISENSIAIFSALEKADFKNGIIHESSIGKIVINSLGTIESEGDLGEVAIADYLNWESQVMTHLDVAEILLRWEWDEDETSDFPEQIGFTKVGYNYMKLLPC